MKVRVILITLYASFLGGFFSDDIGYVGTSCKKCPNGSFVAFDKAPGTQTSDCKSCPLGEDETFTMELFKLVRVSYFVNLWVCLSLFEMLVF